MAQIAPEPRTLARIAVSLADTMDDVVRFVSAGPEQPARLGGDTLG
jgi:hypothetical protein